MKTLNWILFFSISTCSYSQPCHILKNIYNLPGAEREIFAVDDLTATSDKLYFSAGECTQSPEVYAVNTELDSIYIPKNVWAESSLFWCGTDPEYYFHRPGNFKPIGNLLFYVIPHQDFGEELWRTDGTFDGTFLIGDVNPGNYSSDADEFTLFDGKYWFAATDTEHGRELWVSDDTPYGAEIFDDIITGPESSSPANLTVLDNRLHFTTNSNNNVELWETNGSLAGTMSISVIDVPNASDEKPLFMGAFNDNLYLLIRSETIKAAYLYLIDPQNPQPTLLSSFSSTSESYAPDNFIEFNGKVIFTAYSTGFGTEPWITDGTVSGTEMIKDFEPGAQSSRPYRLVKFNNQIYFRANLNGINMLCKSDGTHQGTNALDTVGSSFISGVNNLTEWNGSLWFSSNTDRELWWSDGNLLEKKLNGFSSNGIKDINGQGDALYIAGRANNHVGVFKWTGQNGDTPMPLKGYDTYDGSSDNTFFTKMKNKAFFWAEDEINGRQLWSLSPNNLPEKLTNSSFSHTGALLVAKDSLLVFINHSSGTGLEPWKSDGTPGSEGLILDLNPGSNGSISQFGRTDGEYVYFNSSNSGGFTEGLFITDGSPDGTKLLMEGVSSTRNLLPFNGSYYAHTYYDNNTYLIKTDRTPNGTELLIKINDQQVYTIPENLVVFNNHLYFFKKHDDSSWGLWQSDGTVAGTALFVPLNQPGIGSPSNLNVIGNKMIFWANDGIHGYEPWVSDGTVGGTHIMADLNPAPMGSTSSGSRIVFKEKLFFTHNYNTSEHELMVTDGTEQGTYLVMDIQPGPAGSHPNLDESVIVDSILFFTAFTEQYGRELWQTDGTPTGTFMVQDICPGPCSSSPENLAFIPNAGLAFKAYSPDTGIEPWIYEIGEINSIPRERGKESSSLLLYPNPVLDDNFRIEWSKTISPATAFIIDARGTVSHSQQIQESQNFAEIKISPLPNGMYYILLKDKNGLIAGQEKFIVFKIP